MIRFTLVFLLFLLTSDTIFSQTEGITWSPYANEGSPSKEDTIGITQYDWELLIFGAYFAEECEGNLHDADSINELHVDKIAWYKTQMVLKDSVITQRDVVILELEGIIDRADKREKRKRLQNGLKDAGLGTGLAALIGIIIWREVSP